MQSTYASVNKYITNDDVPSAMAECSRNGFYHLGLLLGYTYENNRYSTDNQTYHTLMGHLQKNVKGVLNDNKEISEKKVDISPRDPVDVIDAMTGSDNNTENLPQVKVKFLCNWMSSKELSHLWNKLSKDHMSWNNISVVWDKEPDYYVVINSPPVNEFPEPEKTILFRMEPNMEKHPEIWGDWAKPDRSKFIGVYDYTSSYNNCEWHISKTYNELLSFTPEKDPKLPLSAILSAKYKDPGHIKRVDFVKFLESKGMDVHVYGDNKWFYTNYKGSLPYHQKDKGLFPYKYTFNVENFSIPNYFTEKIIDGILSECLVFYNGCFNLKEYIPEDSFVYLPLINFEKDYETVKKAIEEDWWSKRLPAIRKAKKIILEKLSFFPRLEKIISEHQKRKEK